MNKFKLTSKVKANGLECKKSLVVLNSMVGKNIKNQYRRSVLGVFWTVLNPLLNMLVMAFVFSQIFGRANSSIDYPIYVLTGNIVFSLLRTATSMSLGCMVDNYDLLTKTRIPQAVFPLSHTFSATVNFLFSLIALIGVMVVRIIMGANVHFHWTSFMIFFPWLPSLMMFTLGISFILATIYVRFRDIKHIYTVFLTLWMYMTPIFYTIDRLGDKVQAVLQFNPMLHYLNYFREIVALGTVPSWQSHLICIGVGFLTLIIGYSIFTACKKKFVLYI